MNAPRPTRRRVFDAAARGAVAAAFLTAPALAGCTDRNTAPTPDPLEPVARRAAADARLAAAISASHPTLAPAAAAVAGDRRAHAASLRQELHRVRATPVPPSSTAAAPPSRPPVPAEASAARDELDAALLAAQTQAAALVGPAPGHRAGLLASISACCASHRAVLP